jgi:hypothetical protein
MLAVTAKLDPVTVDAGPLVILIEGDPAGEGVGSGLLLQTRFTVTEPVSTWYQPLKPGALIIV